MKTGASISIIWLNQDAVNATSQTKGTLEDTA